jgi:hypothetical protein
MTTAYSLDQSVWRERKRPALTSTNAYIVWPVFGDAVNKWLEIPLVIDEYNHGMNSVDQANQLRRNYTVHRPQIYRTWHPQWYWLIDTSAINGSLMTVGRDEDIGHRGHHKYQETLIMELLNTLNDRSVQVPEPYPRWRLLPRPTKCVWCREHQGSAAPRARRRKVLAEVVNEGNPGTSAYLPVPCCL